MPVKDDVAAWRARPSGPDTWADALVRHIVLTNFAPLDPASGETSHRSVARPLPAARGAVGFPNSPAAALST